tara:strand:+ start:633 stop:935 length:303 start_codon:yes stop_codon:yes gene_type:complete
MIIEFIKINLFIYFNMFKINDQIYLKKYFGNQFRADKNKSYRILYLEKGEKNVNNNCFEKYAILDNGKRELLYFYNNNNNTEMYFAEKVPFSFKNCCCFC